jgi:hypothetical protein
VAWTARTCRTSALPVPSAIGVNVGTGVGVGGGSVGGTDVALAASVGVGGGSVGGTGVALAAGIGVDGGSVGGTGVALATDSVLGIVSGAQATSTSIATKPSRHHALALRVPHIIEIPPLASAVWSSQTHCPSKILSPPKRGHHACRHRSFDSDYSTPIVP